MSLKQKTAIITGSTSGIGLGIAHGFADQGINIVLNGFGDEADINTAKADLEAKGVKVLYHPADMTKTDEIEDMIKQAADTFGSVDILVNNAWGGGVISRVESKSPELMEHGLNVGFLGPLWAMVAAHPIMKEHSYGRIVNLCSLNGVNAHMGTIEYNSAKEALRSATRTAAREWAPLGITANIICPAAKSASFFRVMSQFPELIAAADAANPMGRMGDCEEDIGPVAVFLASEGSSYVTGNTIFADGGSHINGSSWAPDLGE